MNDILRTFRLGVVNLLGVTVPGFILLFLLLFGFLAPGVLFLNDFLSRAPALPVKIEGACITNNSVISIQIPLTCISQAVSCPTNMPVATVVPGEQQLTSTVRNLPPLGQISGYVVLAISLILAYVVGYIFRLSTPDDLDMISAKLVLKKMEEDRKKSAEFLDKVTGQAGVVVKDCTKTGNSAAVDDVWPYQGEKDNKFPYLHFKQYLAHRMHGDLAKRVRWGYDCDETTGVFKPTSEGKPDVRSKTFVNLMKIETSLRCPQLSGIIESDEAHIRMLYGTWLACRICRGFIVAGFVIVVIGSVMSRCTPNSLVSRGDLFAAYLIWASFTGLLLIGTFSGKRQIEKLFHYRRVRELFDVVACYDLACKGFSPAGQPLPLPQTEQ